MRSKKIILGGLVISIILAATVLLISLHVFKNKDNDELNYSKNEPIITSENNETDNLEDTENLNQTQNEGFDLSLKSYISGIYSNNTIIRGREPPVINTGQLATGKNSNAIYTQEKSPIKVKNGDYVIFNFTVYNEGSIDGYVNKITNNIPVGLEFIYISEDGETLLACDSNGNSETLKVNSDIYELIDKNNTYWALDSDGNGLSKNTYNGEDTISITCDVESYLGERKLLKAYNNLDDVNHDGTSLESLSISLVLKVIEEDNSGITIRNETAITEAEDINGNKQENLQQDGQNLSEDTITNNVLKDRDSEIYNWMGKDGEKKYQDDEDYEIILLKRVDLALTNFVIAVSNDLTIDEGEYITIDGKLSNNTNQYLRMTEANTTKLGNDDNCYDVDYKVVKTPISILPGSYILYNIRVYNEGNTDAYVGEITDYLPEYLDYVYCDYNDVFRWKLSKDGKTIVTDYLSYEQGTEKNLLKAFDKNIDDGLGAGLDYKDVQVLCKVNDKVPKGTKLINLVEISKYQNENGVDILNDVDSAPNNVDKNKEDDDDFEQIIIQDI